MQLDGYHCNLSKCCGRTDKEGCWEQGTRQSKAGVPPRTDERRSQSGGTVNVPTFLTAYIPFRPRWCTSPHRTTHSRLRARSHHDEETKVTKTHTHRHNQRLPAHSPLTTSPSQHTTLHHLHLHKRTHLQKRQLLHPLRGKCPIQWAYTHRCIPKSDIRTICPRREGDCGI